MPSVVKPLSDSEASSEAKILLGRIKASEGMVTNPMRVLAHHPHLLESSLKEEKAITFTSILPERTKNLVSYAVAQEHSCTYCMGAMTMMLRLGGFTERAIGALTREMEAAEFDERTRAILGFARHLSRSPETIGRADVAKVREAGYKDDEIIAVVALAAHMGTSTRFNTSLDIDLDGMVDAANSGIGRHTLVPLMRFMMKRKAKKEASRSTDGPPPPQTQPILNQIARHPLVGCCPGFFESLSFQPSLLEATWDRYQRTLEQGALHPVTKSYLGLIVAEGLGSPALKELQLLALGRLGRPKDQVEGEMRRLSPEFPDTRRPELVEWARGAARPGDAGHLRSMGHKLKSAGASDGELVETAFTVASFYGYATFANGMAALRAAA